MSNRRRLKSPDKRIPIMMLKRNPDRESEDALCVVCTCGTRSKYSAISSELMMWAQSHREKTGHQLREH